MDELPHILSRRGTDQMTSVQFYTRDKSHNTRSCECIRAQLVVLRRLGMQTEPSTTTMKKPFVCFKAN